MIFNLWTTGLVTFLSGYFLESKVLNVGRRASTRCDRKPEMFPYLRLGPSQH